ncbi:nucleoside hydrolase [Enterobacterales bacterium CwR94]|nr:nucleoside hydrolase [Enterobacterales bacterium CwR94]
MKRIIIDCDPGNGIAGANTDDGLAIALALASPDISLELITTVAGNTPSEVGYAVAQDLMNQLNLRIPVIRGASSALVEPAEPWREAFDNRVKEVGLLDLWKGITPPIVADDIAPVAAHAMGELICQHPGEITLVAIGPLTNVAQAMQLYPQMAEQVKEIVIMGGVFALDNYLKDTNFGVDPEAAHKVLTSGANLTLVPMDVTTQTMMTHQDLDDIAAINTPLTLWLTKTMRPWMDYSMQTRQLPGCWIHDVLVVAWIINQHVATAADYLVGIELSGPTRGRSWRYRHPLRLDINMSDLPQRPVQVLQQVDNAHLLALLKEALRP